MTLPRQTKRAFIQPLSHNAGNSASRAIQAAGDDQASGQPAAAASAASAPYQIAAASVTAAGGLRPSSCSADRRG